MGDTTIIYLRYLIAIVAFAFLDLAIVLTALNPSMGYEISIYESLPIWVWAALILGLTGGVTLLITQSTNREIYEDQLWLAGLIIVILADFAVLSLYIFKDYYVYGHGDVLTHIGIIKDVLVEGTISQNNFYPLIHILATIVSLIMGISHITTVKYLTPIFFMAYICFIYSLSGTIFPSRRYQFISAAASAPLFFSLFLTGMYPHLLSVLMLPLIYYLYFKQETEIRSIGFKILFIIFIIAYPFFHPITALMIICFLATMEVSKHFYFSLTMDERGTGNISFNPILISLVTFTIWILSFKQFRGNLKYLLDFLSGEANYMTQTTTTVGLLEKYGISLLGFAEIIGKMLGDDLIYSAISVVAIWLIYKKAFKSDYSRSYLNLFRLSLWFVFGWMITIAFSLVFHIHDPYRIINLNFCMVVTPILAGYVFLRILNQSSYTTTKRSIVFIICLFLIIVPSILGIFSLYTSNYIRQPNSQVTLTEVRGMNWYFNYKNDNMKSLEIGALVYRFADALMGYSWKMNRKDIPTRSDGESRYIPDHFSYMQHDHLGDNLTENRYAILTNYDKLVYTTMWGYLERFTQEEFDKFETIDQTVAKIYCNEGMSVYLCNRTEIAHSTSVL